MFMAEKYPHLIDTIVSNGQKTFGPRSSLFQNLNENTFFYLICNNWSHLSTTTFIYKPPTTVFNIQFPLHSILRNDESTQTYLGDLECLVKCQITSLRFGFQFHFASDADTLKGGSRLCAESDFYKLNEMVPVFLIVKGRKGVEDMRLRTNKRRVCSSQLLLSLSLLIQW